MRYRKKPVEIEAIQYTGENLDEVFEFCEAQETPNDEFASYINGRLEINTLEGDMLAEPGDWIIRGVVGELYPCKPSIFEATYEKIEE